MATGISSPLALSGLYPSVDGSYVAANGKPFTSVSNAESALNGFPSKLSESCIGLTVLVKESGWTEAKEYWVQPKGTTPETYGLVEKGAGTTDYNGLENKPTIGDGTNTALPIVGNVKVTASTASGDSAGVTVTPGQNTGEIEMQFTLPKGADGADGQDGATPTINQTTKHWEIGGSDTGVLAEGHNPNRGTYLDTDTKPTTGQSGDYIYVVDTSVTPRTANVWAWNGTAFADTGKSVENFGLTFASGQSVSATKIKDENGEESPSAQGVLSAEAGAELAGKTNEVNVGSAASLSAAIALVPTGMRKSGMVVTYYNTVISKWVSKKFTGAINDWGNEIWWVDNDSIPTIEKRTIGEHVDFKLRNGSVTNGANENFVSLIGQINRAIPVNPGDVIRIEVSDSILSSGMSWFYKFVTYSTNNPSTFASDNKRNTMSLIGTPIDEPIVILDGEYGLAITLIASVAYNTDSSVTSDIQPIRDTDFNFSESVSLRNIKDTDTPYFGIAKHISTISSGSYSEVLKLDSGLHPDGWYNIHVNRCTNENFYLDIIYKDIDNGTGITKTVYEPLGKDVFIYAVSSYPIYVRVRTSDSSSVVGDVDFTVSWGQNIDAKRVSQEIGEVSSLDTKNKDVVGAINELVKDKYIGVIGNGITFVKQEYNGLLIPQHKYRLNLLNSNYEQPTLTGGGIIFGIKVIPTEGEPTDVVTVYTPNVPVSHYDFTVPNDECALEIRGRAIVGETIRCILEDITLSDSVNTLSNTVGSMEESVETLTENSVSIITKEITIVSGTTHSIYADRIDISHLPDGTSFYVGIRGITGVAKRLQIGGKRTENSNIDYLKTSIITDGLVKVSLRYTMQWITIGISGAEAIADGTIVMTVYPPIMNETLDKNLNTGGIYEFNSYADISEKMIALSQGTRDQGGTIHDDKVVTMAVMTDNHGGPEATIRRFLQLCNDNSDKINMKVCLGDLVLDKYENSIDFLTNVYGSENIIKVIGNHDVANKSGGTYDWDAHVGVDAYNKFLSGISNWGVTQPNGAATNGLCYFFKDFTTQGVRIVFLDMLGYDTAEDTWLSSVLADAKSNSLAVAICAHYVGHTSTGISGIGWNLKDRPNIGDNLFYNGNASLASATVDSFITGGGTFIAWFVGHNHFDNVSIVDDYNNQLVVAFDTSCCDDTYPGYNETLHKQGTKTQDCFGLVKIDTYAKTIQVFKIGANRDLFGRERNAICISYESKSVLGES